jgi:hypothetical protein
MRLIFALIASLAVALLAPAMQASQDADRVVAGGGIAAPGWTGRIDEAAAKKGLTINSSKFVQQGNTLHLTIGPAAIYWNPSNTAKGDYTVRTTFRELKTVSDHPHPAGLFIGGNNLGTDQQTFIYCVAYGSGEFLVRQFNGLAVTTVARRQAHPAVNKAGADGSVTQDVAWTVKGGRAECLINGTSVAGFDQAEIVGAGKLASTDGVFGIRASHNMDLVFTGFGLAK